MTHLQQLLDSSFSAHVAGRLHEAETGYRRALALAPDLPPVLTLLGTVCLQTNRLSESLVLLQKSLSLNPQQPDAHLNLGNALGQLGRHEEALSSHERAIQLKPDYLQAYVNAGNSLRELRRLDEALSFYDQASRLHPDFVDAHNNAGIVLREMKRFPAARERLETALALAPSDARILCHLGHVFHDMNDLPNAAAYYEKALNSRQDFEAAIIGLAQVQLELRHFDEAESLYEKAIISCGSKEAGFLQSLLHLLQGDYQKGWVAYEKRWDTRNEKLEEVYRACPLIESTDQLAGKRVLLWSEQGFGDVIQFCRYARLVEESGARVILATRPPLVDLLSSLSSSIRVVSEDEPVDFEIDYQCPLMSLPALFGTNLETIPNRIPYLTAPKTVLEKWQAHLGPKTRSRIGLIWAGSPTHKGDAKRSITVSEILALLNTGEEFHCLQKDLAENDQNALVDLPIHFHEQSIEDFSDTAALISQMDLVISVDTSVAHLSGALGKETWLLLPHTPDFRWMLERPDSPWYPGCRLFRQERPGDWTMVIENVIRALGHREPTS